MTMLSGAEEIAAVVKVSFDRARAAGLGPKAIPAPVMRLWRGVSAEFVRAHDALTMRCQRAGAARGPVAKMRAFVLMEVAADRFNTAVEAATMVSNAIIACLGAEAPEFRRAWLAANDLCTWDLETAASVDVDGRDAFLPPAASERAAVLAVTVHKLKAPSPIAVPVTLARPDVREVTTDPAAARVFLRDLPGGRAAELTFDESGGCLVQVNGPKHDPAAEVFDSTVVHAGLDAARAVREFFGVE